MPNSGRCPIAYSCVDRYDIGMTSEARSDPTPVDFVTRYPTAPCRQFSSAWSWSSLPNPKLRPVGVGFLVLTCGLLFRLSPCSGYLRVSGMGAPMRSNASRWVLVGSASIGMVA